MTTTRTFSQVSATAFADELVKIARARSLAAAADKTDKSGKAKRWLKDTSIVAAGAGLGTGAYMLGEKALSNKLGKRWNSLAPATRRGIAGAGSAAATVGGLLLANKLAKEKQKNG